LGEDRRKELRKAPFRLTEYFDFGTGSVVGSALAACERLSGDIGEVGELLALRVTCIEYRPGFDGERESERRICCIEEKPFRGLPCACTGDKRCAAFPGE